MAYTRDFDGYDDHMREEKLFRDEEWRQLSADKQRDQIERDRSAYEEVLKAERWHLE